MKAFFIFSVIVLIIFDLVILYFAIKSRKFFKTLIFNAFMGLCTLAIIDLTAKFSGVYIPVNLYSVIGSSVLGVPAVCFLLILKFLLI